MARPIADYKCVLPPPGPPTRMRLTPLSIQLSPRSEVRLVWIECSIPCYSRSLSFNLKKKTAYEMRIRDWSSDVCSSDLQQVIFVELGQGGFQCQLPSRDLEFLNEIGGAGEEYAPAAFDQGQADR